MFDIAILRKYAQLSDPTKLPPAKLFTYTDRTITVFDAYPKATFHFLVLPRITGVEPYTATRLASLSALVKHRPKLSFANTSRSGGTKGVKEANENKETTSGTSTSPLTLGTTTVRDTMDEARRVLEGIREDALRIREMIYEEMEQRFGVRWDVWMGFHAVPSMEHMHLHVISSDLVSPTLKTKRHYNSFHPTLGFFQHLDDVLEWFEAEPDVFKTISTINVREYESKLKEPMECFRCRRQEGNDVPKMKKHLEREFEEEVLEKGRERGGEIERTCRED